MGSRTSKGKLLSTPRNTPFCFRLSLNGTQGGRSIQSRPNSMTNESRLRWAKSGRGIPSPTSSKELKAAILFARETIMNLDKDGASETGPVSQQQALFEPKEFNEKQAARPCSTFINDGNTNFNDRGRNLCKTLSVQLF